jgi:hypothetical protein
VILRSSAGGLAEPTWNLVPAAAAAALSAGPLLPDAGAAAAVQAGPGASAAAPTGPSDAEEDPWTVKGREASAAAAAAASRRVVVAAGDHLWGLAPGGIPGGGGAAAVEGGVLEVDGETARVVAARGSATEVGVGAEEGGGGLHVVCHRGARLWGPVGNT